MVELREAINPIKVFNRIFIFITIVALVQYFHLMFLTTSELDVLLTWVIFYTVLFSILFLYNFLLHNQSLYLFNVSYKLIFFILIIGFLGKLFSKFGYIESVLSVGLYATRMNEEIGGGGWSTYLAVWFYPAAIIMSMIKTPKNIFNVSIFLLMIVVLIEFIFVGTRGGPLLVILFYLFTVRTTLTKKHFFYLIGLVILFTAIFAYSTEYRSQDSALGSFSWPVLLENTISTQIVHIKPSVIEFCDDKAPYLFPYLFLSHYISHSIGELTYLISQLDYINTGGANYFMREICTSGFCDKSIYTSSAEAINIRGAVYTTIMGTLIYDSSLPVAIFIVIGTVLLNMITILITKRIGPFTVILWVILSVSPIENYFYTGLGLIQFILLIGIYYLYKIMYSFFKEISSSEENITQGKLT
jgi:hypothetical protein